MFQLELFMRQSSESFPLTAAGLMAVDKDLALTVSFLMMFITEINWTDFQISEEN